MIYEGNYDLFHWGWFPDPDPDFILSVMSCGQRPPGGIWSDSFYCNEEYDRLYEAQGATADLDERAEMIKEMQRIVYEDAPYAVLYYDTNLQAFRADRWTGFLQQPAEIGDLIAANLSWVSIEPLSEESQEAAARESAGGISAGVWAAILAAIIVIVAGALFMRRRAGSEDRA